MITQEQRATIARAAATLADYEFSVAGNTLDIKGRAFDSGKPVAGEHSSGNGGWIAWPGEALLPEAILAAIEALPVLIAEVIELEP
ncbi:MAG: hypothetical protein WC985_08525 [Thermoplasmata archaeon]